MPEQPFDSDSTGEQQHPEQSNNEFDEHSPAHNNDQSGEEDDENQLKEDDEEVYCFDENKKCLFVDDSRIKKTMNQLLISPMMTLDRIYLMMVEQFSFVNNVLYIFKF